MYDPIVVVGAGHAAGQFIMSLRAEGCNAPVTLIGAERHPPYQRPPLSKQYLAGEVGLERVYFRPARWYAEQGVDWISDHRVSAIDRGKQTVILEDGRTFRYSTLVLATGARPRSLPLPGTDLDGIYSLRGIEDADRLKERLLPGRELVLIGGGYIGLEVAATARKLGVRVTVLEADTRVLSRVAAPAISTFFEDTHRAHGVSLRTEVKITRIEQEGSALAVCLESGERIAADTIVVGIGVLPNADLAAQAGLATDNGISVDPFMRTSDPHILAVGDCTSFHSPLYGRRVRLESVQNASAQARAAALNVVGKPHPYEEVPTFWSEQYDVRLNIVGLSQGHDETLVRGDPARGHFSVFYLKEGRLLAADVVNSPADFLLSKKAVVRNAAIARRALADPKVPMTEAFME